MPELAEVETLKRYLEDKIIGQQITDVVQNRENLRYAIIANLRDKIKNLYIHSVQRRAKYLILELSTAAPPSFSTSLAAAHKPKPFLIIHLGMSGRFTLNPCGYKLLNHDHLILYLTNQNCLVLNDARRFGMVYFFKTDNLFNEKIFASLGPEPLTNDFTTEYLYSKLLCSSRNIKNLLMDNNIVVGIGNIYSLESLFHANLLPSRKGNSLTLHEVDVLVTAIKSVLNNAIAKGGTTLRDFLNGDGSPGYFKQELFVYGRENQECYKCRSTIIKTKMNGRGTYYCGSCQK